MSLADLNKILAKGMSNERKRIELVNQTPPVVLKEKLWGRKEPRYALLSLGSLGFVSFGARGKMVIYSSGQTFRDGIVRYATTDLVARIREIDSQIDALKAKRQEILKDEFLTLDLVKFEDGRACTLVRSTFPRGRKNENLVSWH